ncbi:hypothetical protein ACX0G9_02295 [Flavitalea flava]
MPKNKYSWFPFSLALIFLSFASCKKTEQNAQQVNQQPYLVTASFGLVPYGLPSYGYGRSYLVGDTAALLGKFFLDQPGFQVRIGNDIAKIIFRTQIPNQPDSINQYTHQVDKLDYVRFVITKSMGIGNDIAVSITANGTTLQAPSISIQQFLFGSAGKTDTTLFVDNIANWKPADFTRYSSGGSLVSGMSISRDGLICFNNYTDLFLQKDGVSSRFIGTDDIFTENGVSFTIHNMMGSVLSIGGDSLTFSAEVLEDTPDTATAFLFRLCKMDLAGKKVRTLNRTEFAKTIPSVDGPVGPVQGAASALSMIAINLKTDLNGSLYFVNAFAPARADFDPINYWSNGQFMFQNLTFIFQQAFNNICRINVAGQVKSLVTQGGQLAPSIYSLPGVSSPQTSDYIVSADGSKAFISDGFDPNSTIPNSFTLLDLVQDLPQLSTGVDPLYHFFSYDTSVATGQSGGNYQVKLSFSGANSYMSNFLLLPDGELLYISDLVPSIVGISPQNKTFYCFAGTEQGCITNNVPSQINITGPAKYVDFKGNINLGLSRFIGFDKSGAIYYYNGYSDYTNGISFYKLYSKK